MYSSTCVIPSNSYLIFKENFGSFKKSRSAGKKYLNKGSALSNHSGKNRGRWKKGAMLRSAGDRGCSKDKADYADYAAKADKQIRRKKVVLNS
ncbi:MAG: hypothetical protein GXP63_05980 [DPANN group archaeon]|nr:hypothetical protein [DPANN group archaeon]